jgi:hypothetical protein
MASYFRTVRQSHIRIHEIQPTREQVPAHPAMVHKKLIQGSDLKLSGETTAVPCHIFSIPRRNLMPILMSCQLQKPANSLGALKKFAAVLLPFQDFLLGKVLAR